MAKNKKQDLSREKLNAISVNGQIFHVHELEDSILLSVFSKLAYSFNAIQLKFNVYSMCVCVIVYKLINWEQNLYAN